MNTKKVSRRDFVKGSAMAATLAGVTMPFNILEAGVSPNEVMNIAHIGIGSRTMHLVKMFYQRSQNKGHFNPVAFCDVDDIRHCKSSYMPKYGSVKPSQFQKDFFQKEHVNLPWFSDYRKMLEKMDKDIDGVVTACGPHNNWSTAMWALSCDKHVYHEKPTGMHVEHARLFRALAEKKQKVTQMSKGYELETPETWRNWAEAGVLGNISEVHIALPGALGNAGVYSPSNLKEKPIPEGLNWDANLTTRDSKYTGGRTKNLKFMPGFDLGMIWGYGVYHMCTTTFGMNLFDPISVKLVHKEQVKGGEHHVGAQPNMCILEWTFLQRGNLAPCKLIGYSGSNEFKEKYMKFPEEMDAKRVKKLQWGSKTHGGVNYGWMKSDKFNLLHSRRSVPRLIDENKMQEVLPEWMKVKKTVPVADKGQDQIANWYEACKANAPLESCGNHIRSTKAMETMLLGSACAWTGKVGKELMWDAKNMCFTNDDVANQFVRTEYRGAGMNWDVKI